MYKEYRQKLIDQLDQYGYDYVSLCDDDTMVLLSVKGCRGHSVGIKLDSFPCLTIAVYGYDVDYTNEFTPQTFKQAMKDIKHTVDFGVALEYYNKVDENIAETMWIQTKPITEKEIFKVYNEHNAFKPPEEERDIEYIIYSDFKGTENIKFVRNKDNGFVRE